MLCYAMLRDVMLCYAILNNVEWCYLVLCCVMAWLWHVLLGHALLCMLGNAMFCQVILRYAMLCHVISSVL